MQEAVWRRLWKPHVLPEAHAFSGRLQSAWMLLNRHYNHSSLLLSIKAGIQILHLIKKLKWHHLKFLRLKVISHSFAGFFCSLMFCNFHSTHSPPKTHSIIKENERDNTFFLNHHSFTIIIAWNVSSTWGVGWSVSAAFCSALCIPSYSMLLLAFSSKQCHSHTQLLALLRLVFPFYGWKWSDYLSNSSE